MKHKLVYISICFFVLTSGYSQLSDIARIEYTNIPKDNSDAAYNRFRVLFNYPIKLKKEGSYLLIGLDYSNINLKIDENLAFDRSELKDFHLIDLNIGYTKLLKNDWRIGVRVTPGLSSNLTVKDLGISDVVLSSDVVFIKDKTKDESISKPWRLIIGASYSENRGFSFPLPFISYYKKFTPKWSYNLGVPQTNLQYHFSEKSRFKIIARLDGFTANLQRGLPINDNEVAESINMSLILAGFRYEYKIAKHVEFFAQAEHTLSSRVRLRDEDKDGIIDLDSSNNFLLRTGVRLKI